MQLNNRNAVISYTVVFLLIFIASIYVVRHFGFHVQNLFTKFGGKYSDEDVNETDNLEKRLQESGDELLAYVEKLADDESNVFMDDNESVKGVYDRAGYESGDNSIDDTSANLLYNPGRIQVSFSEFGKRNNSKDDMTLDALNNIKRNYLNLVGLKKEDAEAAKNAQYARLEQLDENLLSSKERRWKRDEEKRRKKRVISRRGVTSDGTNNVTNIFVQSALNDPIIIERNNTELFNIASVLELNSTNNFNARDGNTSLEPQNDMAKSQYLQGTNLKAWNILKQSEIPFSNVITTSSLKEPKILILPIDDIVQIKQDHTIDQGRRIIKRDDAIMLEKEQKSKSTTPCVPNDLASGANPDKSANSAYPGKPANPAYPGKPANPAYPGKPANPAYPGKPANPAIPGKPANPAAPGKSANSATRVGATDTPSDIKSNVSDNSQSGDSSENPSIADVDSDGDDIAAAKLINGFMQSVMDQASKIGNLKNELGLGRKNDVEYQSFTNINKTMTNEFMSNVFGCVDKLVENTLARQVCGQLPPDMKRFLDWLLKSGVSKEQSCLEQRANGEAEFANFVFSVGPLKNETGSENVKIVEPDLEEEQKFFDDRDKYLRDVEME